MRTSVPILILALTTTACVSSADEPRPRSTPVVGEHVLSSAASIGNTLVLDRQTRFVTCTGPAPDADFSQGDRMAIGVSAGGASDQIGGSEQSSETSMGGRSPAVLLSREMFFRACEFSRNYQLSKAEALALYNKTLDTAARSFATEHDSYRGMSIQENVSGGGAAATTSGEATGYGYGSSGYGYGTSGYGTNGYDTSGYGYGTSGYGTSGYGTSGYGTSGYGTSGYGTSGYGYGASGYAGTPSANTTSPSGSGYNPTEQSGATQGATVPSSTTTSEPAN